MKRILLFSIALLFIGSAIAQRIYAPKELRNIAVPQGQAITESLNTSNEVLPAAPFDALVEEETAGLTYYDLQSNSSMQNRIHYYPDGTIGIVYTYGMNHTSGFDDRGTGYNYFDGNAWGPYSTERIEADRTGWPAYAPLGENGEMTVSHYSGAAVDGLAMSYRTEKGTGDWEYLDDFMGPDGHALLWPRFATGGVDNSVIHVLPITTPTGNGGTLYEGVDGAIVYSRSTDGGQTWDPQNILLDEINSDYYLATSGDTYEIQSRGDVVAFLFGDSFMDLVLMKSTDGGDTWTKTVIYETPYPLWDPAAMYVTDTFYCSDGAHALAIDANGKVHVAFGINRTHSDGAGTFWFPFVDGVGYWNEDRPVFSNTMDALSPYIEDDPDSELEEDYSLVGWAQDVNGNGEWDILDEYGTYYMGASSMPTIHVDDMGKVYIFYSSITETYDNGLKNFRHIWARSANNDGQFWGHFTDLTGDLIHIFDECVFPSLAHHSDDYLYMVYQFDSEPGLHVRGDLHAATENKINFMKIDKADLISGIGDRPALLDIDVAQNQPNPFSTSSTVYVNLRQASELSLEVTNIMGQVVYRTEAGYAAAGLNKLSIDGSSLSNGVYFYTVTAGETKVTKKMIVE
jgi:hypothetical protein